MTSIRVEVEGKLEERINDACNQLNVSPENFARYAIEQEVTRQEIRFIKDEITIQEINRNILGDGQSLQVPLEAENEALYRHIHTCQMCLREFERPLINIDGPIFCNECMDLARGGDFTALEDSP